MLTNYDNTVDSGEDQVLSSAYTDVETVPEKLAAAGFAVIAANGKVACDQGWPTQRNSVDEVRRRFRVPSPPNAAILTGEASDNTVAVDFDCKEAALAARIFLPPTGMRVSRRSKPDSQWFYKLPTVPKYHAFKDPILERGDEVSRKRVMILEVRGDGRYSVVHGVHPSGESISVEGVDQRAEVGNADELLRLASTTAAVAWLARYWETTDRHNAALGLSGALYHAGYPQEEAERIVDAICAIADDEEADDRIRTVSDTYDRGERGENITGWRYLNQHFDERGVQRLVEWLRLRSRSGAAYPQSDAGNAEMFAEMHGEKLRYNHATRRWMVFRRHWWQEDTDGEATRLAIEAVRERQRLAVAMPAGDSKDRELKHSLKSEQERPLEAILRLAAKLQPLTDSGDDWNADPMLLGTANGVVDLRTGELMAGSPEQKVSLHSDIVLDSDADCPRWLRFLDEVFDGEHQADLVDWLWRYIGYSLSGRTDDQSLIVAYGDGANGKSTMLTILRQLLGTMAHHAAFSTLQQVSNTSKHGPSTELASLRSMRLVTAIETNQGVRLDEALIKGITGGDPVTARHLHQGLQTFVPECKVWVAVNHKPVIKGTDNGIWRRMRLVPFANRFNPEAEPDLEEKLRSELPGILAWAVRGCVEYQHRGLTPPEVVKVATDEYRQESDVLAEFVSARCETGEVDDPDYRVKGGELRDAYEAWCRVNGLASEMLNGRDFGGEMTRRFTKKSMRGLMTYCGIRLKSSDEVAEIDAQLQRSTRMSVGYDPFA